MSRGITFKCHLEIHCVPIKEVILICHDVLFFSGFQKRGLSYLAFDA